MKVTVTYQKCYDFRSEITYLGEENPGEHYFSIVRREEDNFWDPVEDECYALMDGEILVGFEGYAEYPNRDEEEAMRKILASVI
jgi:hypothetical protein